MPAPITEPALYLNQLPDAATTAVASWYERGPFSFIYDGPSESNRYILDSVYSLIYNHPCQPQLPNRRSISTNCRMQRRPLWHRGMNAAPLALFTMAPLSRTVISWIQSIRSSTTTHASPNYRTGALSQPIAGCSDDRCGIVV